MAHPLLEGENIVIKEEVMMDDFELKTEIDQEEDMKLDPMLFIDVKPEPLESVDCGEAPDDVEWQEESDALFYENETGDSATTDEYHENICALPGIDEAEIYFCAHCDKSYKRKGALINHLKVHSRAHQKRVDLSEDFKCGICSRAFEKLTDFFAHRKLHGDQLCDECGILTNSDSIFHKLTHIGSAVYECIQCSMSFSQESTLKLHNRTHTNEKCYACEECGESFVWLFQLLKHKVIHTTEVTDVTALVAKARSLHGKEIHKCRVCEKTFDGIVEYSKHVVSHKKKSNIELRCRLCDMTFNDVTKLLYHRTHHK